MSEPFARRVGAAVAVVAVIMWAIAVVAGVIYSFKSGSDTKFLTSDGMKYFVPGLTALVGGVVAASFGLAPPGEEDRTDRNLNSLGRVLTAAPTGGTAPTPASRKIAEGYVVAYLLFGFLALLAWIFNGGDTLDYVRTLASAWGGLFIGVAQGFFRG